MLGPLNDIITRALFLVVCIWWNIFFHFVYFVSPLFSTMHKHWHYNKERKQEELAFVRKEQRKKTEKQEVFQDEIKMAFVFIRRKVENYKKKNPMIKSENVGFLYVYGKATGTGIKISYRTTQNLRVGIYALASGCWVHILALQIPTSEILYRQVIY